MVDLVYIAVIVGFFALAAAFVVACDFIIGPDTASIEDAAATGATEEPAEAPRP